MKRLRPLSFVVVIVLLLSGCHYPTNSNSKANESDTNQHSQTQSQDNTKDNTSLNDQLDPSGPEQTNPAPICKTSDPKGLVYNNRQSFISYNGLQIHHQPPTEEPAKTAWSFFKLQGEQKYNKALLMLHGHQHHDTILYSGFTGEKGTPYLKEVIESRFVRWADITSIAPKENEDVGAYQYKVIYIEVKFKLRGKLTKKQTDMRNGLNRYAVHLIQEKKGSPWEISLLGGSPWLMR